MTWKYRTERACPEEPSPDHQQAIIRIHRWMRMMALFLASPFLRPSDCQQIGMDPMDEEGQIEDAHGRLERLKDTGRSHFLLRAHLLKTQDGGRRKPVFSGYRPQLWIGQTSGSGEKVFWDSWWLVHKRRLDPGQSGEVTLFISPSLSTDALPTGLHVEFYEGPRLVATAEVTSRQPDNS